MSADHADQSRSRQVPDVSVLLPVFNAEPYLQETISSLQRQTLTNFEIVAIDDGSTDGSLECLRKINDPRLRIFQNPQNLGVVATLNKGMAICDAEYIARMDADDIADPTRLEQQLSYMRQHPRCVFLGSGREFIDERGQPGPATSAPPTNSELIRWKLLTGNFVAHPSVMLRKSALEGDLFDLQYRHAEDYAAWLKLSRQGEMGMLSAKLVKVRVHGQSVSFLNKLPQIFACAAALGHHLRVRYGTQFHQDGLALWSAPHEARKFEKPDDYYELLRWMNPLRATFRDELSWRSRVLALVHYYRRLLLLLMLHRTRMDLAIPIVSAMVMSLFPMSDRRKDRQVDGPTA